ncbi:MAG TPA: cupin domain-containing protein [Acidimicrobiales bacterium]|nr:cupin domain-containing protein [Acidimicrobiales bacterium]
MTDSIPASVAALAMFGEAATRTDLEDWGPLAEATGEEMSTSGLTVWSGDDDVESGIWVCTPGPSRWALETNEFVHILSGRMTVTEDGGDPVVFGPGTTALFPVGWTGTWDIEETIRKLYVIF